MGAQDLGHDEDQKLIEYYEKQIRMLKSRPRRKLPPMNKMQTMPAHWHKRQRVWRHNGFVGHTVMMRQHLNSMLAADSTTDETKQLAKSILGLLPRLQNSLATRKD